MSISNKKLTDFWGKPKVPVSNSAPKSIPRLVHITVGANKRRKLWSSPANAPSRDASTNDEDQDIIPSSTISIPDSTLTPPISPARPSSPPIALDAAIKSFDGAADTLPSPSTAPPTRQLVSQSFNTSFTSLPSSTQSFASRRTTTSEGKEAVLDSNSENDTDGSLDLPLPTSSLSAVKSSASLAKLKPNSSPPVTTSIPAPILRRPLQMTSLKRRPLAKNKAKAKTSFEALMAQSLQTMEADKRFETAKSALAVVEEKTEPVPDIQKITRDVITDVKVDEEDDDATDRVWRAMQRTQATQQEMTWYMFAETREPPPRRPFPVQCFPETGPLSGLRNKSKRKQKDEWLKVLRLCKRCQLPAELVQWLIEEVCQGTLEDLVHCYIDILSVHAHAHGLSLVSIEGLLNHLIIEEEVSDLSRPVKLTPRQPDRARNASILAKLSLFVDLLARTSANRPPEEQIRATHLLLRISLDEHVSQSFALTCQIGAAVEELVALVELERFEDFANSLSHALVATLGSPILQQRLLNSFVCGSPRTHFLRRQLALRFCLGSEREDDTDMKDPDVTQQVFKQIARPALRNVQDVDYAELAARIDCVDIAINCGFSDMMFAVEANPTKAKRTNESSGVTVMPKPNGPPKSLVVSIIDASPPEPNAATLSASIDLTQTSPATAQPFENLPQLKSEYEPRRTQRPVKAILSDEQKAKKAAEKAYNRHIDDLVSRIHEVAGRIRITGATNIKGTEARAAAERVALRLEAGLRTRRAESRDAFGTQQGLAGWLKVEKLDSDNEVDLENDEVSADEDTIVGG